MKKLLFFALLATFTLSSCATIVSGSNQGIFIDSTPRGAEILVRDKARGETPKGLVFDREVEDYVIVLRKEGYEDHEIQLVRKLNGWVFGNIIFGGIIGLSLPCWAITPFHSTDVFGYINRG